MEAHNTKDGAAHINLQPVLRSVIIPTFNEAENIIDLLRYLNAAHGKLEVIVSDGGSDDGTLDLAAAEGAIVQVSPVKGRAGQMNHGASLATGEILHFVHADTRPPRFCGEIIADAISAGYDHGSFRTRFMEDKFLLKMNAFFTRFDRSFVRGGDQSIWVSKELFARSGGYKEDMLIMEEYDLLARMRKVGRFHLSKESTLISARKYEKNSWLRVQLANLKAVRMYKEGAPQREIVAAYQRMLNYRGNAFN